MEQLWAVVLGGSGAPGRLTEDHETVFVVAEDEKIAKSLAKKKWSGVGRAHVDALMSLSSVDGYRIELRPADDAQADSFVSYNDDPHDEAE